MALLLYVTNPFPGHKTNFVDFLKRVTKTTRVRVFQIGSTILPFYFLVFDSRNDLQAAVNILDIVKRQFIAKLEFYTEQNIKIQNMSLSKGLSAVIKEYEECANENAVLDKFMSELRGDENKDPVKEMSAIYEKLVVNWMEQEKEIKDEFLKRLRIIESKRKKTSDKQ
ncbi:hypothetical protein THOM_1372 [Trachipleistophora hominis]|uniref:Uncharacterized protein n=1 Tax=Trachipleistophora hominis TaxID=72359 RepID=L7JWN5_TRAHO|nr:hypothetical protein THOM_1372 [Trachipleistophora hominis]